MGNAVELVKELLNSILFEDDIYGYLYGGFKALLEPRLPASEALIGVR